MFPFESQRVNILCWFGIFPFSFCLDYEPITFSWENSHFIFISSKEGGQTIRWRRKCNFSSLLLFLNDSKWFAGFAKCVPAILKITWYNRFVETERKNIIFVVKSSCRPHNCKTGHLISLISRKWLRNARELKKARRKRAKVKYANLWRSSLCLRSSNGCCN